MAVAIPGLPYIIGRMMPSDITFIVVTYNSAHVVDACLKALPSASQVIVIDNGSRDNTVELASRHSSVEIIRSHNIGYGRAANIGLLRTTTPYAVLLNPDTTLCDGAITVMCDCASAHGDIGVLGARMIDYEDNTKNYHKRYRFDAQGLCYTDWIVGALMLFNMTILRQVGMFDEHIFLFFEETDLCDRMLKAGYKLAICQHAEAEHYPGTSSTASVQLTKIKAWHTGWSRAYYFNKQVGFPKALRKSIGKVVNNLIRIVNRSTRAMCRMRRKSILSPIYEIMGTVAYCVGVKAFRKDGTARIT